MRAFLLSAVVLSIVVALSLGASARAGVVHAQGQDQAPAGQEKTPQKTEPAAPSTEGGDPGALQERPLTLVSGAKKRASLVAVGQKIRFISANGTRVYDGVFDVQDGFHSWVQVGNDEGRSWWVNLSDVEAFEIVP